jgi:hypothetical protein
MELLVEQMSKCPQIVRQPAQNLVRLESRRDRRINRPIERHFSAVHTLKCLNGQSLGVRAEQHCSAKPATGFFGPLGEREFLSSRQERILTGLGEVQTDRVVGG